MRKLCGQLVNILGAYGRKTRVRSSTRWHDSDLQMLNQRVKQMFIHTFIPQFYQLISPLQIGALPLAEHYLYPVSTAPTNNRNQRKLKKGNK